MLSAHASHGCGNRSFDRHVAATRSLLATSVRFFAQPLTSERNVSTLSV